MSSSLVEQTVMFESGSDQSIDQIAIMADSRVQSWFNNSTGKQGQVTYGTISTLQIDGSYVEVGFMRIDVMLSAANAALLLLDIPGLRSTFSQYVIATWGYAVTFGT